GIEHDAETLLGLDAAEIAASHIARDELWGALEGRTEAAAAWRLDGDAVAGSDLDILILGEMRRHVIAAVAPHRHAVQAAGLAAGSALRAEAAMIHDEGGARRAAAEAHLVADAEAAALASSTARTLGQGIFLEEHGIAL